MRYFRHLRFTSSCRDRESTHSCVYTHRNTYPCSVSDIPLTSPKSRILFKNRFSKSVGSTSVKGFFSETISGSGCGKKKKSPRSDRFLQEHLGLDTSRHPCSLLECVYPYCRSFSYLNPAYFLTGNSFHLYMPVYHLLIFLTL